MGHGEVGRDAEDEVETVPAAEEGRDEAAGVVGEAGEAGVGEEAGVAGEAEVVDEEGGAGREAEHIHTFHKYRR